MSELTPSPDHSAKPATSEAPAPVSAKVQTDKKNRSNARGAGMSWLLILAFVVLGALLAASWWNAQAEIKALRQEIAQRLQAGDNLGQETRVITKSIQDGIKDLQLKVNLLEGKQIETQSQQLAMEQMYEELSKNRDDWALAETEQVLSVANQQLELAGNVRGALIALQNADARLARTDHPQAPMIRRAIAADIETLKLLPSIDVTGLAMRLDSAIGQIDSMPLLTDAKPAMPATEPKSSRAVPVVPAAEDAAPAESGAKWEIWLGRAQDKWHSFSNEMWSEVRQLVQIRNVENPDALLLSPTEAYYARENLKLRLLNARLALLSRNEPAFRNDLIAAQDTIAKYFDTRAKRTQVVQALLKQVQTSDLSIDMPNLSDSLTAVRTAQTKAQ